MAFRSENRFAQLGPPSLGRLPGSPVPPLERKEFNMLPHLLALILYIAAPIMILKRMVFALVAQRLENTEKVSHTDWSLWSLLLGKGERLLLVSCDSDHTFTQFGLWVGNSLCFSSSSSEFWTGRRIRSLRNDNHNYRPYTLQFQRFIGMAFPPIKTCLADFLLCPHPPPPPLKNAISIFIVVLPSLTHDRSEGMTRAMAERARNSINDDNEDLKAPVPCGMGGCALLLHFMRKFWNLMSFDFAAFHIQTQNK